MREEETSGKIRVIYRGVESGLIFFFWRVEGSGYDCFIKARPMNSCEQRIVEFIAASIVVSI